MIFNTLVGLLPFLASAQAYFILSHPVLETTRFDPIVQPGQVSQHVHSIVGGSNFDKTMSYASARQSRCTTAQVSEDKSNYWTHQMYYYNPQDKSYQAIPVAGVNTYYLPRAGADGKVRAFPDGLRMVSGSPNRRTFNNDADSKAVTFVCLDYSGSHQGDPDWAERNSFFTHNCPNGMRAQVFFRSCWDGVNLDAPDHVSHMAWPSGGVDGGECPATHPVRLVSLFFEFIYNTQNFPFNDPQYPTWVLANGDTTGYGFHGDFLNGWPSYNNGTNILQKAIDGCNDNNGVGGELQNCPPFVPYLDRASANSCGPQNLLVNEDVGFGHSISQLPGNNPIWIGNGTKPSYTNYTESSTNFTDFKSVIPTGYTETGCIAEGTTGRALNALYWSSANMTRGACVSYCQSNGFPLAGVQYGSECRCDTAIRNGGSNTTLLDQSRCGMKCSGNNNENCGGSAVMNLFNNPSMYKVKVLPTGWINTGCFTEGTSGRALSGFSFTSTQMTQDLCVNTCASKGYTYAGAEWSQECYCGNSLNAGSVKTTDDQCANSCNGDPTTICGGSSRLTVFRFSNTTASAPVASSSAAANASSSAAPTSSSSAAVNSTSSAVPSSSASSSSSASPIVSRSVSPAVVSSNTTSSAASSTASAGSTPLKVSSSAVTPSSSSPASTPASTTSSSVSSASPSPTVALPDGWQANGCVTEATGARALSGYSFTGDNMTPQLCIAACQARAYKYAGVEYGRECYCGDAFNAGSNPAPDSDCKSKCAGNSALLCGGSNRLTTLVNTVPKAPLSLPSGWSSAGCYQEPSTGRALGASSIASDSMTIQQCIQTAQARGYSYAGLEYARECWMANSINTGSAKVDDAKCSMSCAGDLSTRCGGGRLLSVYSLAQPSAASQAPSGSASASSSSAAASSSAAKPPVRRGLRRSRS